MEGNELVGYVLTLEKAEVSINANVGAKHLGQIVCVNREP
jgi:hypothetical protein